MRPRQAPHISDFEAFVMEVPLTTGLVSTIFSGPPLEPAMSVQTGLLPSAATSHWRASGPLQSVAASMNPRCRSRVANPIRGVFEHGLDLTLQVL